jgi:putative methyltransferase (TIGR04325 family)
MNRLKQCLPPEAIRIGRHVIGYGSHFRGNCATWEEACASAEGYAAPKILEHAVQAALAMRDGVYFTKARLPYPLLAGLMRAAMLSEGHLRVVDFGGSLGSSYFQCRPWFRDLASLTWRVVEQPHFVEAGRAQLADDQLMFFTSIAAAADGVGEVDVVLFSSVLQYLSSHQDILAQAIACKPRLIIVDRTPVISDNTDVICIQKQHFPAYLVPVSLPIRLFVRQSLMGIAEKGYSLMSEFDAWDKPMGGIGRRVDFKGFIFERER